MFTQITERFSRFASKQLSISHFQHNLQEWIRNQIVDDDPYVQQETIFNQASEVNRKNVKRERLVNFQTKLFALVSISEAIKTLVVKDLKVLQAYKSVISNKRVYH